MHADGADAVQIRSETRCVARCVVDRAIEGLLAFPELSVHFWRFLLKQMALRLFLMGSLLFPVAVNAQTAADISAMVDQKMDALDEFEQLLNDPDPQRSLTAMNIMIGHDDPQIARMALQYGLTSTSAPVRRAALKAYLDTEPVLNMYLDGSALDAEDFEGVLASEGGTVDGESRGYMTKQSGPFNEDLNCYAYKQYPAYCLITLSESNVGLFLWQRAASLTLNAEGSLEGVVFVKGLRPAIPLTIPIRP